MMGKISRAYQHYSLSSSTSVRIGIFILSLVAIALILRSASRGPTSAMFSSSISEGTPLTRAATWNIAAINNNPFEYWITSEDPSYNEMMSKVSSFVSSPGSNDVLVSSIFSDDMYNQLELKMKGLGWSGLNETRKYWADDFKNRKIITGFLRDGVLGKKRLASMPDRVTNTIVSKSNVQYRPTVINCYDEDLSTLSIWFSKWLHFIFEESVRFEVDGVEEHKKISSMLSKIKRAKYPTVTEEEERISIPLQTLSCAIFDAILVHMMNTISPTTWQGQRKELCGKLNRHKEDRTIEILEKSYADSDVIFLQEVASSLPTKLKNRPLSNMFEVHYPSKMDKDRDQNSFILLKKGRYTDVIEVTDKVLSYLVSSKEAMAAKIMVGDLLALQAKDVKTGDKLLLASFHGDTNGLATVPVVTAAVNYLKENRSLKLLFGLDANTYAKPEADQQGVEDFGKFYRAWNLNSCYGKHPNPQNFTTFHARTFLQPQLNKVSESLE